MKKFEIGSIVVGKVTGIEDYGIFVSLENGTTGLIHISEISELFVKNVEDYAKIGDLVNAVVLEYDEKADKLKLSMKSLCSDEGHHSDCEISETKSGFQGLKESLNTWISEKQEEICKNQKKSQ